MSSLIREEKGMSRNAKIGIGVVLAVLAACLCLCLCAVAGFTLFGGAFASRVMQTDPEQARLAGQAMLNYELPEGYHELAAMDILTVKMVMIARGENIDNIQNEQAPMIIIGQVAQTGIMDDPQLREQIQRSMEQSFRSPFNGQNVSWELVDSSPVTIAGEDINVDTYEGTSQDGTLLRQQITDVFNGNGKPTFIMVVGPSGNWPKDAIETFYASIK